jgi:hypothetical protein
MGKDTRLKLQGKSQPRWFSGFVKPAGKFWKRKASKRARKVDLENGSCFKKVFGWFEWS